MTKKKEVQDKSIEMRDRITQTLTILGRVSVSDIAKYLSDNFDIYKVDWNSYDERHNLVSKVRYQLTKMDNITSDEVDAERGPWGKVLYQVKKNG